MLADPLRARIVDLLAAEAIQVARLVDRRRARRAAIESFHDIDDDQASPLDRTASPLDPEPVAADRSRSASSISSV